MATFSWIIDGESGVAQPYVRMLNDAKPGSGDYAYDLFNLFQDGSGFVFQRTDVPTFVQEASNSTNSGTTVTTTLPVTATADNLLVLAVLVDETAGTRTITPPAGFTSMGGNELFGSMRLNTYVKKSAGTEGAVVTTVSTATEFIAILTEYSGFINDGFFLRDVAQSDTGTSTSPALSSVAEQLEAVELWIGVVGNRNTSAQSAPTNSYALREDVASAGMRLAVYERFVGSQVGVPDFGVTLGASQNWIARAITVSPTIRYIEGAQQAGIPSTDLFLRNFLTMQIDDVPANPPTNHARVYLRENPLASGKEQFVAMWDDGTITIITSKA